MHGRWGTANGVGGVSGKGKAYGIDEPGMYGTSCYLGKVVQCAQLV